MNDRQIYDHYLNIPTWCVENRSWIYPDYVVIIGRAFKTPHPHRHYTFEEFVDKLHSDPEFKKKLS